jgi:hypothetical protein
MNPLQFKFQAIDQYKCTSNIGAPQLTMGFILINLS